MLMLNMYFKDSVRHSCLGYFPHHPPLSVPLTLNTNVYIASALKRIIFQAKRSIRRSDSRKARIQCIGIATTAEVALYTEGSEYYRNSLFCASVDSHFAKGIAPVKRGSSTHKKALPS